VRRDGGEVSEARKGSSFHTLVLPLAADADACRVLEARFAEQLAGRCTATT
jgi:hypothetical protein